MSLGRVIRNEVMRKNTISRKCFAAAQAQPYYEPPETIEYESSISEERIFRLLVHHSKFWNYINYT